MEVINSINGKTQVCQASSHSYPLEVSFAATAIKEKTVIVCGGYKHPDIDSTTAACYQFDQNHQCSVQDNELD